jgi:hypothetical protein
MLAWERSAKLKFAERILRIPGASTSLPDGFPASQAFVASHAASIAADRLRHWGTTRQPARWSGSNLANAASDADLVRNLGFREFYDGEHDVLYWGTHGATLALVRDQTVAQVSRTAAIALEGAIGFAIVAAALAAEGVGMPEPERRDAFDGQRRAASTPTGCSPMDNPGFQPFGFAGGLISKPRSPVRYLPICTSGAI